MSHRVLEKIAYNSQMNSPRQSIGEEVNIKEEVVKEEVSMNKL